MKRNDEIVLRLISPRIEVNDDVQITVCEASLGYQPSGEEEWIFSDTFLFNSPIGKVELADINWYLRQFHKWPFNAFHARGKGIEANLTLWGSRLFDAIQQGKAATEVLDKWLMREGNKLFTVQLDTTLLTDVESRSAAANLLQIPWELLCNKAGYLIEQFTIAYRRLNGCQSSLLGPKKAKRDKAQPM